MLMRRWKMDELDSFWFDCKLHRGGKTGAFVLTFPTRTEAEAFWRYKSRHFGVHGKGGPNREVMIVGKRPSHQYRSVERRHADTAEAFNERDPFGFKAGKQERMPAVLVPRRRSVVEAPSDF